MIIKDLIGLFPFILGAAIMAAFAVNKSIQVTTPKQLKLFADWEETIKAGQQENELRQLKALQQKYGKEIK